MGAPTPALETVITAIKAQMDTIASIGTVYTRDHNREDDGEEFFALRNATTALLDVWYIGLESQEAIEGPGVGENYAVYNIRIRHVSLRKGDTDWVKTARGKGQEVADKLEKNASVFRISSQPQIRTEETVTLDGYVERSSFTSEIYGPQVIVEGFVRLSVEARRWT